MIGSAQGSTPSHPINHLVTTHDQKHGKPLADQADQNPDSGSGPSSGPDSLVTRHSSTIQNGGELTVPPLFATLPTNCLSFPSCQELEQSSNVYRLLLPPEIAKILQNLLISYQTNKSFLPPHEKKIPSVHGRVPAPTLFGFRGPFIDRRLGTGSHGSKPHLAW
jgi:hypothetical protein